MISFHLKLFWSEFMTAQFLLISDWTHLEVNTSIAEFDLLSSSIDINIFPFLIKTGKTIHQNFRKWMK